MKIRKLLLTSAFVNICTAFMIAQSGPVPHTWVSGSGSNSNPCSFALPCLNFTGALAKTSAGGVISAKDAGDFGSVTINQSVTIDGNNLGSITFNNTVEAGVAIHGGANVTIENLFINGLGTGEVGISVTNGGIVTIDNCKIMNFTFDGIEYLGAGTLTVENSRIESFIGTGSVNGLEIESSGAENVSVKNTVIDASPASYSNSGIVDDDGPGPVKISLQNVTITNAGTFGIDFSTGVAEITNSVLTQSGIAVYAVNGATISVASSLITANATGVCSWTSSKIRLDNNDIYDNTTAIANCGGTVKTSTTNKTSGTIAIPSSDVSDSVTF